MKCLEIQVQSIPYNSAPVYFNLIIRFGILVDILKVRRGKVKKFFFFILSPQKKQGC